MFNHLIKIKFMCLKNGLENKNLVTKIRKLEMCITTG